MNIKNKLNQLRQELNIFTSVKAYSQEGEDLILKRLFQDTKKGFYVDVGANHPSLYSNTNLLYKKGWRGLNIEPTPRKICLFNDYRKRDINIQIAISNKKQSKLFYMFEESQLNSFDYELSLSRDRPFKSIMVKTDTLANVLQDNGVKNIHFLNIDCENHDYIVLKSNDWKKYKPLVIAIEEDDFLKTAGETKIKKFLSKKGYQFYARTHNTSFYIKKGYKC